MNQQHFYPIGQLSVVDVSGADAAAIVHNVTTNEVRSLERDSGNESFVTDVRGKTLGHVVVYHIDDKFRLIGPVGQSDQITGHLDRYTIREDAVPAILDEQFSGVVLPPALFSALTNLESADESNGASQLHRCEVQIGDALTDIYECRFLGEGSGLLLVAAEQLDSLIKTLETDHSATRGEETDFHAARIRAGFPWYGIDMTDANLPQEADRDASAISFTKGCYLGQETVARLDAMGQVQKKLVNWAISGGVPNAGSILLADEKKVGRLSSVAEDGEGGAIAIGPARRSHFDPGSEARTQTDDAGGEWTAIVR